MAAKMIKCKICGADIAASAKVCPSCGAKNRKPIYKKWWFYVLIVVVIIIAINSGSGGNSSSGSNDVSGSKSVSTSEPVSYTHYNVTQLFDDLKENALKAKDTYNKQYVELEGYLETIDSDGKYISVGASENDWDYAFDSIHCSIKNDDQKSQIMNLKSEDPIIVRGKITDVGEVLGYYLDIDSIN